MKLRKRSSLFASVMICFAANAVKQPNVIVIFADDLGYQDIGVQGCADVPTPNIDSLAANGVRCTDAYVTAPV